MNARSWAYSLVTATTIEVKLEAAPSTLFFDPPTSIPGDNPVLPLAPGRPQSLSIVPAAQARVPKVEGMAAPARRTNDEETAQIYQRIHQDEVSHVAFGWHWLSTMKRPESSMWDSYRRLDR